MTKNCKARLEEFYTTEIINVLDSMKNARDQSLIDELDEYFTTLRMELLRVKLDINTPALNFTKNIDTGILVYLRDINGNRSHLFCKNLEEFNKIEWEKCYDDENEEILMVIYDGQCIYNALINDKIHLEDLIGFFA